MAITTWDSFFEVLEKSGMLDSERFQQARQATQGLTEPTTIARRLVTEGLLSRWQASQLLAGEETKYLGKFKLLDELEATATSRVYLAEHTDMNRRVALKTLPRRRSDDDQDKQYFQTAVAAVAALDHPNINHIIDVDCEDGHYYLVMEHCDGHSLSELVKADGPLDYPTAANVVSQAATGLEHAHRQNMIHGDIRPATLVLSRQGTVKIIDMGLNQLAGEDDASSNGLKSLSPDRVECIAPELTESGATALPASDVYSLGCTFYFLLTGQLPFGGRTTEELIESHRCSEPKSILDARSDAPAALTELCRRMMAKRVEDRPATAQEVADVLGVWLDEYAQQQEANRPQSPPPAVSSAVPFEAPASPAAPAAPARPEASGVPVFSGAAATSDSGTHSQPAGGRGLSLAVVGITAAVVLLAAALGAAFYFAGDRPTDRPVVEVEPATTDSEPEVATIPVPRVASGNGDGTKDPPPDEPDPAGSPEVPPDDTQQVAPEPAAPDIQRGLFANWNFEKDTTDRIGGADGEIRPGLKLEAGVPDRGGVLNFDGSAEAALNVAQLRFPSDAITVAAWIKLARVKPLHTIIAEWDDSGPVGKKFRYNFALKDSNLLLLLPDADNPDIPRQFTVAGPITPADGWVHVAFTARATRDAAPGEVQFYRDGEPLGEPAPYEAEKFSSTSVATVIGNYAGGTPEAALVGSVDDVRIYDRALQGVEIAELAKLKTKVEVATAPPEAGSEPDGLAKPGRLLLEIWRNVQGKDMPLRAVGNHIKENPDPDAERLIDKFEEPKGDDGDNLAVRIRGFLRPEQSGAYKFTVVADDRAVLYLSTDDKPENKKPVQMKTAVTLKKGQSYYVEAIGYESDGDDHLIVSWTGPNGITESPIPGKYLSVNYRQRPAHERDFVVLNLNPLMVKSRGVELQTVDNTVLARLPSDSSANGEKYGVRVDTSETAPGMNRITAVRIEALPNDVLPARGPGFGRNGAFSISEFDVTIAPRDNPSDEQKLTLVDAFTDPPKAGTAQRAIDGEVRYRWICSEHPGNPVSATFIVQNPVEHKDGSLLTFRILTGDSQRRYLGCFRLSATTAAVESISRAGSATADKPQEWKPLNIAINCGGNEVEDPVNRFQWKKDQAYADGGFGHEGGKPVHHEPNKKPIRGSAQIDMTAYRFTVPNGKYLVRLLFVDNWGNKANDRVFTFAIERKWGPAFHPQPGRRKLDLVRDFGKHNSKIEGGKPFILVYTDVLVEDGVLDVEFKGKSPLVNAIQIRRVPYKRKRSSTRSKGA